MNLYARVLNRKNLPYNLSADRILLKVSLVDIQGNSSYLENIELKLYSNFDGSDNYLGSWFTNDYGSKEIEYRTDLITDKTIDTALMWIKYVYNGTEYISNKVRVNFVYDADINLEFTIIDAGYDINRNANIENIYDAGIRHPSNPSGVLDDMTDRNNDYTIIERGNF